MKTTEGSAHDDIERQLMRGEVFISCYTKANGGKKVWAAMIDTYPLCPFTTSRSNAVASAIEATKNHHPTVYSCPTWDGDLGKFVTPTMLR